MPFCVQCAASISHPAVKLRDTCQCGLPMAQAVPGSRQLPAAAESLPAQTFEEDQPADERPKRRSKPRRR